MRNLKLVFTNNMEELQRTSVEVETFLQENKMSGETIFNVLFVLEEMVSNIIKYGFKDNARHDISLEISKDANDLQIVIEDDGIEFNPLSVPPKDTSTPVNERKIGGLGIHLVRNMSKNMSYGRSKGINRLQVVLSLG